MKKKVLFVLFGLLLVLASCSKSYKVTFDLDYEGATYPYKTYEVKKGNLIKEEPPVPERDYYEFKGWFKEGATTEFDIKTEKITADTVLKAKWERKKVTITFDSDGGNDVASLTIDMGTKATKPTDPEKEGYDFAGWYDGAATFDFTRIVEEDVTLKAKWVIHKVTVTLDLNYDSKVEETLVEEGQKLVYDDPVREGYLFAGWYLNDELFDVDLEIINDDITLKASWVEKTNEVEGKGIYSVTQLMNLFTNGGDGDYYLVKDFDLSGVEFSGTKSEFSGTLDGNGKTISNYNVEADGNKKGTMFGYVLDGGVIKNLTIKYSSFVGAGEANAFITAYAYGGSTFENIEILNVKVDNRTGSYSALLFGDNHNDPDPTKLITVKNIIVRNNPDNGVFGGKYTGGLVGDLRGAAGNLSLENIYFMSNVYSMPSNGTYDQVTGALIGRLQATNPTVTIKNAVIKGEIYGSKNVGALVGTSNAATLIAEDIFVEDYKGYSESSAIDLFVGNGAKNMTLNITKAYYNSETTTLYNKETLVTPTQGEAKVSADITETWFETTTFNKDLFKVSENKIVLNRVEEVKEDTIGLDTKDVKKLYIKGIDTKEDYTGLVVKVNYTNATSKILTSDKYTIEHNIDFLTVGTYQVTVTVGEKTASYDVRVVDPESVTVNILNVKQMYKLNEQLDLSSLVVELNLSDGTFIRLNENQYSVTNNFDATQAGKYGVTVKFNDLTTTYYVFVSDKEIPVVNGVAQLTVDASTELNDGTLDTNNNLVFKTLKNAITYLESMALDDEIVKIINIKNGTYFEKITIRTKNVVLIGESQENTIIDYNAAAGLRDPNGAFWGTQGSATLSVKSTAVGFTASNLTISNSFDYDSATFSDKQAVALVVEADKALFYKVSFKGLQDTLYAKLGRHYFYQCYIEGHTDFIFGNNATSVFDDCEIKTINRNSETNNGYITAHQGQSSGNDTVKFGYVFLNSRLTAEEGTTAGTVALGRPWRQNATVAYINTEMGAHISKLAYDASEKVNQRWEEMSGNLPQNAKFVEYGSTGDGAISEAVLGGSILTAEQASEYTLKNIFAQINGEVDYGSEWNYVDNLYYVAPELVSTVTFNYNYTDSPENVVVRVLKGTKVSSLDIIREGYTFGGWSYENNETPFNFDNTNIDQDMEFKAIWKDLIDPITITFVPDNGSDSFTKRIEKNTTVRQPDVTLEKSGYIFDGWYLNDTKFDFSTVLTEDTTLKAKWIQYTPAEGSIAISTADELIAFFQGTLTGYSKTGKYYLANNIDMTGKDVGTTTIDFAGVFDGNYKTISNLHATASANKQGVFFRYVYNGGVVKNFTLENSSLTGIGEANGFITTYAYGNSTFENITFENVSVTNHTTDGKAAYAAILIADANAKTGTTEPINIKNIVINNDENNYIEGDNYTGALIGGVRGDAVALTINIENVYINTQVYSRKQTVVDNVVTYTNDQNVSSIIGRANLAALTINVKNTVIKGGTTGSKNAGTIIGTSVSGVVLNAESVFVEDYKSVVNSGQKLDVFVGNTNEMTLNLTNAYYNSTSLTLFRDTEAYIPTQGEAVTEVTQDWLVEKGFNTNFFKVVEGKVVLK